ncbi:lysozyme inhibitor LprI family protein [Stenotrophomonas maltophilia]|uniref:lysozyme inhibitor LprI family protein n=1 Tax=Stenotrophomonas TaxID=40323 RepID=UPI000A075B9E|nr:lysozyme inhibitor LprI family protein [Stenotrophomonas sp. SKA14]
MSGQRELISAWFDGITSSAWWPVFLPLGYGIFRFLEYLLKRRVEGKPSDEQIQSYSQLADLQKKLRENSVTIADLNALRSQVLGKGAASAINIAHQYSEVAQRLVADVEEIDYARSNSLSAALSAEERNLTQAEMNILSAEKAQEADRELTALVLELMQKLHPQGAALLQRAQGYWLAFRKVEADREASAWEGGSILPLMVNAKFEAMTRERIAALKGDTTGPDGSELDARRVTTPRNLLQHLELNVPMDRVRDLLGTPTYSYGSRWMYRYEETQVEVGFNNDWSVDSVVVALCNGHNYPGVGLERPLGQLTVGDVIRMDSEAKLEHGWSARTQELCIRVRTGPAGAWDYHYFGALSIFSGAGDLQDVRFEWDADSGRLVTNPDEVLVNWMAISAAADEPPSFNWYIR